MKNHRFPWLKNRTTDNRKCEKARNIKEKRTIEMFSPASKPLVAHLSSASADLFNPILIMSAHFGPTFFMTCFLLQSGT